MKVKIKYNTGTSEIKTDVVSISADFIYRDLQYTLRRKNTKEVYQLHHVESVELLDNSIEDYIQSFVEQLGTLIHPPEMKP